MAIARVGRTRSDTQSGAQRGLLVRAQELIDELAEIDQTRRAWINEVVEVLVEPGQRHIPLAVGKVRSEEHTSELQSLMRISYAVFCLKKNKASYINYNSYIPETLTK